MQTVDNVLIIIIVHGLGIINSYYDSVLSLSGSLYERDIQVVFHKQEYDYIYVL